MATPRNNSYSIASGSSAYLGRALPAPTWMTGATLLALSQLANSTGAGGAAINAYSGGAIDDQLRIFVACAGGHQNASDNRVAMLDCNANTPAGWTVVAQPSPTPQVDVAYYPDGKPTSRHTYNSIFWHSQTRTLYLIGCYGAWTATSPLSFNTIDGFNTDTLTWYPAGTFPYTNGSSLNSGGGAYQWGSCLDPSSGAFFFGADNLSSVKKWIPGSAVVDVGTTVDNQVRWPRAWDSKRSAQFGIMYGNGQGSGSPAITAVQTLTPSGTPTKRTITFNSSAGLTQFLADAPAYMAMDYDAINDYFLVVYNTSINSAAPARYIKIIPNSSTVWDMQVVTPTGSAGNVVSEGMCGRLWYVQRAGIGGFLLMTAAANGVYFLRTA